MRIAVLMLAACATGAFNCSATAHGAPRVAPPAGQRLPHMSLSSVGTGQPVVLIPGLSTPRAIWDEVVPKLARTGFPLAGPRLPDLHVGTAHAVTGG